MKSAFHEQPLLSAAECDDLIAMWGEDHGYGKDYVEDAEYISKRTSVIEMPEDLFARLRDVVSAANATNWRFEGELSRSGEIYRYQPGDFFDWHMDLGSGAIERRKLTTLIQLSSPRRYKGGRLELFCNESHTASTRRGTVLVYPAFLMHRVTEVTEGVRFSIGGEFLGEPFK